MSTTDGRPHGKGTGGMKRPQTAGGAKAAFAMFQQKDKDSGGTGKATSSATPSVKGPKEMLLEWCKDRTRTYENVDVKNYSSSWANGLAFCALVHSYFPDAFDYNSLDQKNRRYNLKLAFDTAESKANVAQLLDVEDMMIMGDKPDWKCVFTYIQGMYRGLTKAQ